MNGCICWPLAEVQAHFIADGDPPTDAMLKAVFASVQRLGLAERCPDHPHNWRITNNGLVGLVRSEEHTSELQSLAYLVCPPFL